MEGWGIALYSINAGNGTLTYIKSVFLDRGAGNLKADPSGKFLYFLSSDNQTLVGAFAIDPVTGDVPLAFQPIPLAAPSSAVDMVVTP